MYRVSPAGVSQAEGELIRCEGALFALETEFERKALESVELIVSLNESYSAVLLLLRHYRHFAIVSLHNALFARGEVFLWLVFPSRPGSLVVIRGPLPIPWNSTLIVHHGHDLTSTTRSCAS